MSIPTAFKSMLSAFKRADELDRDPQRENRIVAYFIRYWAVTKSAKVMTNNPEEQRFVAGQLDLLEKLSPQLNIAEGEGKSTCIQQGTLLFDRADEIDRAGFADKATAKLFYTAATIYDCLEQFGETDEEILERKKYAKWKAADIVNAINSGLRPTPGGFGEQTEEEEIPSAPAHKPIQQIPSPDSHIPTQPNPFSQPPPSNHQTSSPYQHQQQPTPPSLHPPAPRFAPPTPQPPQNYVFPTATVPRGPPQSPADPRVKDSIELAQFAISAMNHNNINLARERLQEALRRLS